MDSINRTGEGCDVAGWGFVLLDLEGNRGLVDGMVILLAWFREYLEITVLMRVWFSELWGRIEGLCGEQLGNLEYIREVGILVFLNEMVKSLLVNRI